MEALTYRMEGDYQVPNLTLPEEPPVTLGKYALLRKNYLKHHRRILFANLLTNCKLNQHLMEIEQTANERMELMVSQMAAAQGVNEQMKAADQMKWVGMMNNIRHSAEETILSDLIYA
ncbi:MAG TPA: TnpV protein [Ruminococcaceae bacterium]|nr:TnpV protein [Oscillospiraceae bacterium]